MTIRDHLSRQKRIIMKVWLYSLPASLALVLILVLLADRLGVKYDLPGFVFYAPLIVGFAVFVVILLRLKLDIGLRCPCCKRRTVTLKTRLTGDLFAIPKNLEACPSCRASFDQEYTAPDDSGTREER